LTNTAVESKNREVAKNTLETCEVLEPAQETAPRHGRRSEVIASLLRGNDDGFSECREENTLGNLREATPRVNPPRNALSRCRPRIAAVQPHLRRKGSDRIDWFCKTRGRASECALAKKQEIKPRRAIASSVATRTSWETLQTIWSSQIEMSEVSRVKRDLALLDFVHQSMRSSLTLWLSRLSTMTSPRSYSAAIDALNSLQSNAAVIDAIRKSGTTNGEAQMVEGVEYLKRIGYTVSTL